MADRRGLVATWVDATFRPGAFFERDADERSAGGPLNFAIAVGVVAWIGQAIAATLFGNPPPGGMAGVLILVLIGAPLVAVATTYASAGLVHLALRAVGAATKPFRATRDCVAHATGPNLFGAVPWIGPVVALFWGFAILIIGLKKTHGASPGRAVVATIAPLVVPVMVALGLRVGAVEAFKISTGGMTPTLVAGDRIFIEKLSYGPLLPGGTGRLYSRLPPKRGDVMVFKYPERPEQDFVQRAIALPGDTLEVIDGRPVVNGLLLPSCYLGPYASAHGPGQLYVEFAGEAAYLTMFNERHAEARCDGDLDCPGGAQCRAHVCGMVQGPYQVAPGEVWTLGDNRDASHDSRAWRAGRGAGVPFDNIKGRAKVVWWSYGEREGIDPARLMLDLTGRPELPHAAAVALAAALDKCLADRPTAAAATPPRP